MVTRDPLVLCVGNPARGDDGAGARVADLLLADAASIGSARVHTVHQLDVAHASDVAEAGLVVFVDAERRDGDVTVTPLEPARGGASTHHVSPRALLALAQALYGAAPAAFLVSVPAGAMPHAETLTPRTEAACIDAASAVIAVLSERQDTSP
ncbi:MAG: hydrogenase maturation protease [Coriobacteriia bacterium]|nr:hydrogenase maturation protease [Coriobacteriia bacterium]